LPIKKSEQVTASYCNRNTKYISTVWTNFRVYSCYNLWYMQLLHSFKELKIISYKKHILLTPSDHGIEGQKAVLVHLLISLKPITVFAWYYEDEIV
jgi:hypothetical protein